MKYIASVSFGKDSLAMLLRLLEEQWPLDYVVFYNTGMEYQSVYNNRDKVKELLGDKFIELSPRRPFLYDMLEREVHKKDGTIQKGVMWCGGPCNWGTREKTRVIDKFKCSLKDDITEYVGIAADEPSRIKDKTYPLVQWGMTEADCLQYCYDRGYNWLENGVELYSILDRVSCWCCRNKNKKELRNMFLYLPDYWNKLKDLQAQIPIPFKPYTKRGVQWGDVFQMEEHFKAEQIAKK